MPAKNESLTLTNEAVKAALLADKTGSAFLIGEPVFIRTVTYHLTGRIIGIKGDFLLLDDAAWVADSGRFTQAINNGELNEVEPVDVFVRVNINTIVDTFHWAHPLPRKQK